MKSYVIKITPDMDIDDILIEIAKYTAHEPVVDTVRCCHTFKLSEIEIHMYEKENKSDTRLYFTSS